MSMNFNSHFSKDLENMGAGWQRSCLFLEVLLLWLPKSLGRRIHNPRFSTLRWIPAI